MRTANMALCALLVATPVAAQEDGNAQLEQVVVTAQRKTESLQTTPVSVVALNSDKLQQRGIAGMADLQGNIPNLTIEPFPTNQSTLRLFIRGIGIFDAQITQDPGVGVYQDGVYVARSTGLALDLADLERIEVLRGPQGTLYGRNTIGGAINLITKRPSTTAFTMSHQLVVGSRDTINVKSSVNVPITSDLAVKFALLRDAQHGWVDNTGPGGDFGNRRDFGARADLRWLATEWLGVDYSFDHADMTHYNYLYQAVSLPTANKGVAENFKPYAVANTVYSEDRLDALASGPPFEPSTTRIDGHALILTTNVGFAELKYTGSYRKMFDATYADLGGGKGSLTYRLDSNEYDGPAANAAQGGNAAMPTPTPLIIPALTQSQWSHELQLSGFLFGDEVQYITGLFYFQEKAHDDRHHLNHQFSTALDPQQLDDQFARIPAVHDAVTRLAPSVLDLVGPRLVNFVDLNNLIDNEAAAFYGQATWTPELFFDQRLHMTFGYRHSIDRRDVVKYRVSDTYLEAQVMGQGTATVLQSGEMFDNVHAHRNFSDNSITAIGSFDMTKSFETYVKMAEAYKSGGFNDRDPQISGASGAADDGVNYGFGFVEGFAPEHVRSYEAGFKSEWFHHRLRLNADVFRTQYRDMQINFLITGTISDTKTRNAGRAHITGFEAEATALLVKGLQFSADYAYLDANIDEVRDVSGNNVAPNYRFASAPRHSLVGTLDWTVVQGSWGNLRGYVNYSYLGARFGSPSLAGYREGSVRPSYSTVNARVAIGNVHALGGYFDFALYGRNLTNRDYIIDAIDNLPQANRAVLWGEPLSYGADVVYRFY